MHCNHSVEYVLFLLTLFVGGSLVFLVEFFILTDHHIVNNGIKAVSNGTDRPKRINDIILKRPVVEQEIILMVIDAWRLDFSSAAHMPYANTHLLANVTLKVDIPTVTMPRIKSLTTGSVTNFIDVIYNLGHTEELHESLLHRMQHVEKKAVVAGDNTWFKLFPKQFARNYMNTNSFFVNDFIEGDFNVTNAMKQELEMHDWQLLILHYLGLDHIGHVEGSDSQRIHHKLLEMDNVIQYIHQNTNFANRLLFVTGDHGMRNGGGHGSSEKEELYVPLMLLKAPQPKSRPKSSIMTQYRQIDVACTLAVLLDIDIPSTSLGVLIGEFINQYSREEQLYFYLYNSQHLFNKMQQKYTEEYLRKQDYYQWLIDAKSSHERFLQSKSLNSLAFESAKQNYKRLTKSLSNHLSNASIHFRYDLIIIALLITTSSCFTIVLHTIFGISKLSSRPTTSSIIKTFMLALVINIIGKYLNYINSSTRLHDFVIICCLFVVLYLQKCLGQLLLQWLLPSRSRHDRLLCKLHIPKILLAFLLFHTLSMSSSSYIEEEHQTWYYLTSTLFIYLSMLSCHKLLKQCQYDVMNDMPLAKLRNQLFRQFWQMRYVLQAMIVLIVCRRLNRSGNKWYHLLDIGDIFNRLENARYLHLLLLTALVLLFCLLKKFNSSWQSFTSAIALLSIFYYRVKNTPQTICALMIFWLNVILTFVFGYRQILRKPQQTMLYMNCIADSNGKNLMKLLDTNLICSLLISALLSKEHNVVLLPALLFILETSYSLCDNLYKANHRLYGGDNCALVWKTLITIFIAQTFYFFQGNTNSLSSIDLNPGFIGFSKVDPFITPILITFNLYSAYINSFLCLLRCIVAAAYTHADGGGQLSSSLLLPQVNGKVLENTLIDLSLVQTLLTACISLPMATYWCLLLVFRYHLFIYSVFSPKAVYQCFQLLYFYINIIVTYLYFKFIIGKSLKK